MSARLSKKNAAKKNKNNKVQRVCQEKLSCPGELLAVIVYLRELASDKLGRARRRNAGCVLRN